MMTVIRMRVEGVTDLQLMLLPVDDDGCDLLVHEDQDGAYINTRLHSRKDLVKTVFGIRIRLDP